MTAKFIILTWGEEDSQSSKKAWSVWYPYRQYGFKTVAEAEDQILKEGCINERYHIVELTRPVKPTRALVAVLNG